jgi:dUTP pyrophosphatase
MVSRKKTPSVRVAEVVDPHGALQKRLDYDGDVGYDLACTKDETIPANNEWIHINTEVRVAPPPGFWFELCSRSSALDRGLVVARGIIDAGYRGTLVIRVKCEAKRGVYLRKGERIAQLIAHPIIRMEWKEVEKLEPTDRGENGFGSTG